MAGRLGFDRGRPVYCAPVSQRQVEIAALIAAKNTAAAPHAAIGEPSLTWDNCHAVNVWFTPLSHVIVWRKSKHGTFRLIDYPRLRDVKSGDLVEWEGQPARVWKIELYR